MKIQKESGKGAVQPPSRYSGWYASPSRASRSLHLGLIQGLNRWSIAGIGLAILWIITSPTFYSIPIGLLLIFTSGEFLRRKWITPLEVERMMDLPGSVRQYPASVTFLVSSGTLGSFKRFFNIPLGRDEGLISFADGSLYFEGTRSSFSIDTESVDSKLAGSNVGGSFSDGEMFLGQDAPRRYSFTWKTASAEGAIEVNLFATSKHQGQGLRILFRKDYSKWLSPSKDRPRDIVFPPVAPAPEYLIGMTRVARAWGWIVVLVGAALFIFFLLEWFLYQSLTFTLGISLTWMVSFVIERHWIYRLNVMKRAKQIADALAPTGEEFFGKDLLQLPDGSNKILSLLKSRETSEQFWDIL